MLRRRLDRPCEPEHVLARSAVQERHVLELHPAFGDGSRLVEDDRGDSARSLEHLGAADEDPELGAAAGSDHESGRRRKAERARARDDEDRHRSLERRSRTAAEEEPARERREREREDNRHEDRRHSVGEALDRRLARLGLRDQARDLRERGLVADPRRTHEEPSEGVDRRSRHARPRPDVHGRRLSGQHRLVDRRLALDDHTVGRDLLAGTHDEHVAHDELRGRHRDLRPVPQDTRLPRPELEERANRRARSAPRSGLEVAAEEDQRRDDGGHLEVRVALAAGERDRRPAPRGDRPDRDERVHRRGAATCVDERGAVEVEAGPEHDRSRQGKCEPLPPREVQRREHCDEYEGRRERRGEAEPSTHGGDAVGALARIDGERRAVACRLDRAEKVVDAHPLGVEANGGSLGREVHGRVDAVELVEAALDPARAGRAGHPLKRQVDPLARVENSRAGGVSHTLTIPPLGI